MYLEYDAIVPTSRNPGANHAKLRDFRVVLFGLYFSSSIRVYPYFFSLTFLKYDTFIGNLTFLDIFLDLRTNIS